jgi:uncharacterized membrane protein
MKKFLLTSLLLSLSFLFPSISFAQTDIDSVSEIEENQFEQITETEQNQPFFDENTAVDTNTVQPITISNEYYIGKVVEIVKDDVIQLGGFTQPFQALQVEILDGPNQGETFIHEYQLPPTNTEQQKLSVDDKVVVIKSTQGDISEFYIAEPYRFPSVIWVLIAFFIIAIICAGKRGFTSILGLIVSLGLIGGFLIPQIVAGQNPLFISLISSVAILFISLYLSHGFNKRTTIALAGTFITLIIAAVLAVVAVEFTQLFGLGSEESITLLQGKLRHIDFRGLLLAGSIIGALGVLDDVTTAQSATVEEIHRANPKLDANELYKRGSSVGREHIASLINTLALAYVGAGLPLLLIFTQTDFPLWINLNSEFIVEEIIQTLVGSTALILAVPITTYLAAKYFENTEVKPLKEGEVVHTHSHGHKH